MQIISRHIEFSQAEWAALRASTPMPLTGKDLESLSGLTEQLTPEEVSTTFLPLSRLLNLHVHASQTLHSATDAFLGTLSARVPYVIGIAGSVAVGKSTAARLLQALIAHWPDRPRVDLVTTDGFLYPTKVLEQRGILNRKGFPESYDQLRLVRFLTDVKSGRPEVSAPVYSHLRYDVIEGEQQVIRQPDILILEGLNVLQARDPRPVSRTSRVFVSDFFDFSIYLDAEEEIIEQWYIDRFLRLRDTVFTKPDSYFHRYANLSREESIDTARSIWRDINGPNLRDNIQPTRERAHLILRKGRDHSVEGVRLRRI